MSDQASTQTPEWPVVSTDAGAVTLATVEQLRARAGVWRDWAAKSKAATQTLREQADDHLAAAGGILVAHVSEWVVPPQLRDTVQNAESLTQHIASDDQTAGELKQQETAAGIFGRIGVRNHEHQTEQDRGKSAALLRPLLVSIGRAAPQTTLPTADAERKSAVDLEAEAASTDLQVQAAEARAAAYESEVANRSDAIKAMGFDSLYEAAVLQTSGAQPVDSPLVLKKGEQAYLSTPATLARMVSRTHYVGGSSGFSFPIGHTGIRYRVGSFRGQPIRDQSLTNIDNGTLVLSNQRVAYLGRTKSVSVPLSKLLHVEVFNDGISIAREGRENPDFLLLANPKHVVFLMNWCLSRQAIA